MRAHPLLISTLKSRDWLDRARKRFHRRSYWRSLAREFPMNGLTLAEVEARIEETARSESRKGALVPLPGFAIRRGKGSYRGHSIGAVEPLLEAAFRQLSLGETPSDISLLLKSGLAFQTANSRALDQDWALVMSPHRDDAALSIGGLMHQHRAIRPHLVCNVFTICAWLGEGFRQSPVPEVSRLRWAEEKLSNQILGSTSIGLDLWDAEVRTHYRRAVDGYPELEGFVFASDPHLRTPGEEDSIRRAALLLIATLKPSRVYFPLGLGSHLDHRHLRDLGKSLCSEIQERSKDTAVYFFEDQPYATYEEVDAVSEADSLCSEVIDITDSFEAKIQAIAAHRSQFHREENEERLFRYASELARKSGLERGRLAERVWRAER